MMTHDHMPDAARFREMFASDTQSPVTERAYAVYLAVLLIGQRTPEELVVLAEYLQTGTVPIMR